MSKRPAEDRPEGAAAFAAGEGPPSAASRRWSGVGVALALVYPTIATLIYFVGASELAGGMQQAIYVVVKGAQFLLPVAWVWLVLRERPAWQAPRRDGLWIGAVFALVVVAAGWLVFTFGLRETAVFQNAAVEIRAKIVGFGIDTVAKYALLGLGYSLIHSLLEEYYWRWFVFGQLRRLLPLWPAVLVSAAGFMGHHVVVLSQFFAGQPWLVLLFSAAVGVGGVFWAWLYERTGSLYGPWLSHLLIDAGIFWIGYDLVRDLLATG